MNTLNVLISTELRQFIENCRIIQTCTLLRLTPTMSRVFKQANQTADVSLAHYCIAYLRRWNNSRFPFEAFVHVHQTIIPNCLLANILSYNWVNWSSMEWNDLPNFLNWNKRIQTCNLSILQPVGRAQIRQNTYLACAPKGNARFYLLWYTVGDIRHAWDEIS